MRAWIQGIVSVLLVMLAIASSAVSGEGDRKGASVLMRTGEH